MATKTWNVGDVLAAADMNEWAGGSTGLLFAVKAGDTSRTTNTTLANDPDLSVIVGANKYYLLDVFVAFLSPSAAGFKYTLSGPSGAALNGYNLQNITQSGGIGGPYDQQAAFNLSQTYQLVASGSGFDNWFAVRGIIDTAGTGGPLTLQWAQTSSSGTTIVRAGSAMVVRRVA